MTGSTLIPIYTTRGDVDAFLVYPYLYNRLGEWIGWVTPERDVYSVLGYYVGWLDKGPRILRKRGGDPKPRRTPPPQPGKIRTPAHTPLPPMMADLSYDTIDVLEDEPERLHTLDTGEMREDLD